MSVRILVRGGLASEWTSANPTLAAREIGVETDSHKLKIGDGVTAWTSLAYMSSPTLGGITVSGTPSVGQVVVATSPTAAEWAAASGGGGVLESQVFS